MPNSQVHRHSKMIHVVTLHTLAPSGGPHPSTRAMRIVSTQRTVDAYDTSHYRHALLVLSCDRTNTLQSCGPFLRMSQVAGSACLGVKRTRGCAKPAGPINMPVAAADSPHHVTINKLSTGSPRSPEHRCKTFLTFLTFFYFSKCFFYLKKMLAKFRAASRLTRSIFEITAKNRSLRH